MKPAIRVFVFVVSILVLAAGIAIIATGTVFLERLDDHMSEHAADYLALARHYGSITAEGTLACLCGCAGLALVLNQGQGFRAAGWSAALGLASMFFGLFLFSIHSASGAVYFCLVAAWFGAAAIFLLAASVRYVRSRSEDH